MFVDLAILVSARQSFKRIHPASLLALKIEQSLGRPCQLGIETQSTLGKLPLGLGFAFPFRFEIKTAQSELLGVGR